MWANLYELADKIPDDKIPKNYDLRNISGVSFVGKVRE